MFRMAVLLKVIIDDKAMIHGFDVVSIMFEKIEEKKLNVFNPTFIRIIEFTPMLLLSIVRPKPEKSE